MTTGPGLLWKQRKTNQVSGSLEGFWENQFVPSVVGGGEGGKDFAETYGSWCVQGMVGSSLWLACGVYGRKSGLR